MANWIFILVVLIKVHQCEKPNIVIIKTSDSNSIVNCVSKLKNVYKKCVQQAKYNTLV